ncbi:uncharacterized protein L201_003102 [Kwoniella dendrophila CBS 6074]|uniref:Zinc finger PHD-type domain-containing protein n=1 Tax=Kwoniella dendrophila CBS 6074 TaxID=1295534 RepID=A0AAX4JUG7_9TREE
MPRKLPLPLAVAPIDQLLPPLPPSPIIQLLRKDWRWASISQFIWTFSDAFGLVDWDIEALEADFDGDEKALIPTLIAKLLFALTYNRQINRDNAFDSLRKTHAKRKPDQICLLGTEEEPIEWGTLGLSQKVQILHELCEWQLEDPARFRGLLKSEEEAVTWRVEPVGWDKDGNTYWLFDDNRLWIQRLPPPPPAPPRPIKKTSQKAKKAAKKSRPSGSSAPTAPSRQSRTKREFTPELSLTPPPPEPKEEEILSGSRRRKSVNFYGNPTPTIQALKRGSTSTTPLTPAATVNGSSSRPTRSSMRNNPNSNQHQQIANESPSKSKDTPSKQLPLGTRVSRRLRNVDDEWQQVPDEWLSAKTPSKAQNRRGKAKGKGKEKKKESSSDDESELSELTDEEEHERLVLASGARRIKDNSPLIGQPINGGEELIEEPAVEDNIAENAVVEEDKAENTITEAMDVDVKPPQDDSEDSAENVEKEGAIDDPNGDAEPNPAANTADDAVPIDAKAVALQPATLETKMSEVVEQQDEQDTQDVPEEKSKEDVTKVNGTEADIAEKIASVEQPKEDEQRNQNEIAIEGETNADDVIQETKVENINGDVVMGEQTEATPTAIEEVKAEVVEKKSDLILAWEKDRSHIPSDFIEWEAVCVTLFEWRTFPEQFANSKDPDEQALYALLTEEVGPTIISILVAKEQERLKQEAVNNRKRSSRIATKEFEREEIIKREAAEREMEERMEKIRSEEIRKQKEEEEALAIQKAREDRLKEREERAQAREEALLKKLEDELKEKERKERKREKRKRRREGEEVSDDSDDELAAAQQSRQRSSKSISHMNNDDNQEDIDNANNERWELNCEVCKKVGWNIDEDLDLVCCDDCSRWQHTECHDRLDIREGRGKRNWDQVDFKCKECRLRAARKRQRHENPAQPQTPAQGVNQINGHSSQVPQSPYPVVPGSSPSNRAQAPLDPSRPPPPPLAPGQFYLPYPHPPANEERPAGYAVYYPPPAQQQQQSPSRVVQSGSGYQGSPLGQVHPHQQQRATLAGYPVNPQAVHQQHQQHVSPSHPQCQQRISPSQQAPLQRPVQPQLQGQYPHVNHHVSPPHSSPSQQQVYIQNGHQASPSRTAYIQGQHTTTSSPHGHPTYLQQNSITSPSARVQQQYSQIPGVVGPSPATTSARVIPQSSGQQYQSQPTYPVLNGNGNQLNQNKPGIVNVLPTPEPSLANRGP